MIRLLSLVFLMIFCVSLQAVVPPPPPGSSLTEQVIDPLGGAVLAKGSQFQPEASYNLIGAPSVMVYCQIWSTDAGSTYYYEDWVTITTGRSTKTFAKCDALPPGDYICTTASVEYSGSSSVLFSVSP